LRLRIYFNTSALNRPFDDLSSDRVRVEAEAVAGLFAAIEEGRAEMATSDYLEFEASQNPDRDRAHRVLALLRPAGTHIRLSESLTARAREFEQHGLRGLDALHLACAEAAQAAVLVTTDDRMIRAGARAGAGTKVRVLLPTAALAMLPEGQQQ
jgi:predicted nucleic acid-binding protein